MDEITYQSYKNNAVPGLVSAHGFEDSLEARSHELSEKLKNLKGQKAIYSGKVRDRIDLGEKSFLFSSDRISAFDVILGLVPAKGEILNKMSLYWFDATRDIIENHVIQPVGGRGLLCKKAKVLPVEVIVRGHLTGSAWRDYKQGKAISGISLKQGLKKDQAFDTPIITPSTKAELGLHDEPISSKEIIAQGLVSPSIWVEVERAALSLFKRGQELSSKQGLILVDTKYEFGIIGDRVVLVDEIHTPDSSRYWYANTYKELFEAGLEQQKLDKEFLRSWLLDRSWSGQGTPPHIPESVFLELGYRYIKAFEEISGLDFSLDSTDAQSEIENILSIL